MNCSSQPYTSLVHYNYAVLTTKKRTNTHSRSRTTRGSGSRHPARSDMVTYDPGEWDEYEGGELATDVEPQPEEIQYTLYASAVSILLFILFTVLIIVLGFMKLAEIVYCASHYCI